jgi:cytochrome o ubiquinol oxidase operon protein cyoD
MSHKNDVFVKNQDNFNTYVMGFGISILLTLASYFIVTHQLVKESAITWALIGFGSLQAILQLVFFLHLGSESKPKWKLLIFTFMLFVVVILVAGSLWVMTDLNSRMMPCM